MSILRLFGKKLIYKLYNLEHSYCVILTMKANHGILYISSVTKVKTKDLSEQRNKTTPRSHAQVSHLTPAQFTSLGHKRTEYSNLQWAL